MHFNHHKCRAIAIATGKIVTGFIIGNMDPHKEEESYRQWLIFEGLNISQPIPVRPETICRHTGQKDAKGNDIYEKHLVQSLPYRLPGTPPGQEPIEFHRPATEVRWNGWMFVPFYFCTCGCCKHEEDDFNVGKNFIIVGDLLGEMAEPESRGTITTIE